nr:hypothetical protein [Tanacetum cinerariifolium]
SVQHPARTAHGRHREDRHAGRLRDALLARHSVALRSGVSADSGGGALRLLGAAAATSGPGPEHRHPRAGQGDRSDPASGALRLGRSRRVLP